MHASTIFVLFTTGLAAAAPASQAGVPGHTVCSSWTDGSYKLTQTADNHCCVSSTKDSMNCCQLEKAKPLDSFEMSCQSPSFWTSADYQNFLDCNNGSKSGIACLRIPKKSGNKA